MIAIDTVSISAGATKGTVVGHLMAFDATGKQVPCKFSVGAGTGLFAVSSTGALITTWTSAPPAGFYSVPIAASGVGQSFSDSSEIIITVTAAAAPPPPTPSPDGSTITAPSTQTLIDGAGNAWGFGAASKSWSGQYDILLNGKPVLHDPANYWGGNVLYILAGGHLYFTNPSKQSWEWNGSTFVSTPLPGTPPPPPPPPPPSPTVVSLTLNPMSSVLLDTAPAGTTVSTATVTMSDGSKYTGALTISPASALFSLSGINIVTGRGVAASDDGSYALTVSAGGKSAALNVTVKALPPPPSPTPIITVNPAAPSISDTTPKGAVVASFKVGMSDGSPFTGTVQFGPPNNDGNSVFALANVANASGVTTGQIIVSPTGPGVGPNTAAITDHITLQATS